jgi:hypothetical protein
MRALPVLGTVLVTALAVSAAASPQRAVTDDPAARITVDRFDAAVAEYLRTHRFASVDLETLCLPDGTAAAAPRLDEPPAPREGDLFSQDLVRLIRARIAALALDTTPSRPARGRVVVVGDRLAAGRSARLPKVLAAVLPRVPDDIEYRLVGADLLLVDTRTYVVIDALRQWRG